MPLPYPRGGTGIARPDHFLGGQHRHLDRHLGMAQKVIVKKIIHYASCNSDVYLVCSVDHAQHAQQANEGLEFFNSGEEFVSPVSASESQGTLSGHFDSRIEYHGGK